MRIYAKRQWASMKASKIDTMNDDSLIRDEIICNVDKAVSSWDIKNRHIIPKNVLLTFTEANVLAYKDCRHWYDKQLTNRCRYCGEAEPICLLFHHRIPKNKVAPIAPMVKARLPLDMIQAEASKCDVVCRNCHIKLHGGMLPIPVYNNSTPCPNNHADQQPNKA